MKVVTWALRALFAYWACANFRIERSRQRALMIVIAPRCPFRCFDKDLRSTWWAGGISGRGGSWGGVVVALFGTCFFGLLRELYCLAPFTSSQPSSRYFKSRKLTRIHCCIRLASGRIVTCIHGCTKFLNESLVNLYGYFGL